VLFFRVSLCLCAPGQNSGIINTCPYQPVSKISQSRSLHEGREVEGTLSVTYQHQMECHDQKCRETRKRSVKARFAQFRDVQCTKMPALRPARNKWRSSSRMPCGLIRQMNNLYPEIPALDLQLCCSTGNWLHNWSLAGVLTSSTDRGQRGSCITLLGSILRCGAVTTAAV